MKRRICQSYASQLTGMPVRNDALTMPRSLLVLLKGQKLLQMPRRSNLFESRRLMHDLLPLPRRICALKSSTRWAFRHFGVSCLKKLKTQQKRVVLSERTRPLHLSQEILHAEYSGGYHPRNKKFCRVDRSCRLFFSGLARGSGGADWGYLSRGDPQ